jgi:hypothetical protein
VAAASLRAGGAAAVPATGFAAAALCRARFTAGVSLPAGTAAGAFPGLGFCALSAPASCSTPRRGRIDRSLIPSSPRTAPPSGSATVPAFLLAARTAVAAGFRAGVREGVDRGGAAAIRSGETAVFAAAAGRPVVAFAAPAEDSVAAGLVAARLPAVAAVARAMLRAGRAGAASRWISIDSRPSARTTRFQSDMSKLACHANTLPRALV